MNFSYDLNGNLTGDGMLTLSYDSESRLTSAARGPTTAAYTYDPFGRRLTKTVNGVTTRFLYDGEQLIAETNSGGAITAKYLYGPGIDEPLRQVRGGTSTYYHADGVGSTVALTDASGNLTEFYAYDIYGAPRITGPKGNQRPVSAYGNSFLFTGREWDSETGLYHYRARGYHPGIGRFLQRDPLTWLPDDPRSLRVFCMPWSRERIPTMDPIWNSAILRAISLPRPYLVQENDLLPRRAGGG